MADDDAALEEEILHVAEAEVKAKVQPDGVSDIERRGTAGDIQT